MIVQNFADFNHLFNAVKNWKENPFTNIVGFPGEYNLDQYSKLKRRCIRYFFVKKCALDIVTYVKKNKITEFFMFNDERPQSLFLIEYIDKKGFNATYVEDGAMTYGSFVDQRHGHYLFIGKIIFGPWWRNVDVMGVCPTFRKVMALFPEYIRPELKHKKVEKIDLTGVYKFAEQNTITDYFSNYRLTKEELKRFDGIILLPYSSILNKNPEYKNIIVKLIRQLSSQGYTIAVKYHPRDANADPLGFKEFDNVRILNPAIPVEFIFLIPQNHLKFVISDSSTTLMSALWSLKDCTIISLGELMGSRKDERFNGVLKSLGISLPLDFVEMEKILLKKI